MDSEENTLSIEVEFLLGRSFSASSRRRDETEWPPHPNRLFSALVAACMECDLGEEARNALLWLESLNPPSINASNCTSVRISTARNSLTYFVPVNDLLSDSENRNRQPRWFPSMSPENSRAWYIWKYTGEDDSMKDKLQRIAENVTYLGSSMSPVRVMVRDNPPPPIIEPSQDGNIHLRVPGSGRLRHLEEIYSARKGNTYVQPRLGRIVSYLQVGNQTDQEVSGNIRPIVFYSLVGGHIPPEEMGRLSESLRRAIIGVYPDPVPPDVTGHNPDGSTLGIPHMAVTPILDTGRRYSNGHIMGIAVWIPASVPDFIFHELTEVSLSIKDLSMDSRKPIELRIIPPADEERIPLALRRSTYSRKSRVWASTTPIIFGKHPKKTQELTSDKVIIEMFRINNLPLPVEFRMGRSAPFRGSPVPRKMYVPAKFSGRLMSHVVVKFPLPVMGPVIIGSGRYLGYGLMMPFPDLEVKPWS